MKVSVLGYKKIVNYDFDQNKLIQSINFQCLSNYKLKWKRPELIFVFEYYFDIPENNFYIEMCNLLGIKHVILFYEGNTIPILKQVINNLEIYTNVNTIQLVLKFNDTFFTDELVNLVKFSSKLSLVIVYNSPVNKNLGDLIHFFTNKMKKQGFSKNINLFNVNLELFSESQEYNTYFNRKLVIGFNGEIKNAIECNETFGNIKEIKNIDQLREIILSAEFQVHWKVHKELCDVCKDCEFRHMCVDNRLPHKRKENEWYHKIECNYNPYIAKWEGEEGYRTLAECGVISNQNEFSIDHENIALINKELWGEDE